MEAWKKDPAEFYHDIITFDIVQFYPGEDIDKWYNELPDYLRFLYQEKKDFKKIKIAPGHMQ